MHFSLEIGTVSSILIYKLVNFTKLRFSRRKTVSINYCIIIYKPKCALTTKKEYSYDSIISGYSRVTTWPHGRVYFKYTGQVRTT